MNILNNMLDIFMNAQVPDAYEIHFKLTNLSAHFGGFFSLKGKEKTLPFIAVIFGKQNPISHCYLSHPRQEVPKLVDLKYTD